MAEANQPIVIDNGTGVLKAGFAGGDKPRVVFRSCVGRIKHPRVMPGGALEGNETFLGAKIDEHRGALRIEYPIDSGIVQNWTDMERIWSYIYAKDMLNVASEEHPVLLTEAPLNPLSNRVKAAEVFFEGLNVPALYCSIQAVLALYASGRTTGVVLDSGDGVTHIVPVYEGLALPHAMTRVDLGGRMITRQLQLLLRRNSGVALHSSAEFEIVRNMKEELCYVASMAQKSDEEVMDLSTGGSGSGSASATGKDSDTLRTQYRLPDGNVVSIGSELYRAPEILFQPDLIGFESPGVHELLLRSIAKTDLDLRRVLLGQVVLSGGNTLFRGFGERLLSEMRKHSLAPRECKIRIAAPPERVYSTWIGGSILASLSTFKSMWVSKKDYQEHGARLLTNKLV